MLRSVALDEEIREITQKIRLADRRDVLDVTSAWAVRPDDLLQLLNQYRLQLVHFSGHGSSAGELILVDNSGMAKPVTAVALKALFTTLKDNIQIVVLNACYTRFQAEAINTVIDYVIGMNTSIGDRAAITFEASFYRALAFDRTIQEAFDQAVTALVSESIPEDSTPHLLVRQGASQHAKLSAAGIESDAELIRGYRKLFSRPAFHTPCIEELSLDQLNDAIDDTQAALNTGSLYSRSSKLLSTLPERIDFQSPKFKQCFDDIGSHLTNLKRLVVYFTNTNPDFSGHGDILLSFRGICARGARSLDIRRLIQQIDAIDELRNTVLCLINELLEQSGEELLQLIEVSSDYVKAWVKETDLSGPLGQEPYGFTTGDTIVYIARCLL